MFNLARVFAFAPALVLLALSASAAPQGKGLNVLPRTNAERLARGYPLLPPRIAGGSPAEVDGPTPVRARRSSPSSVPPTNGHIKVTKKSDGSFVGYVPNSYVDPSVPRFGITVSTDPIDYLSVSVPSGNPSEISMNNPPDADHPFLGFVVGPAGDSDNLASGSANYILLTGSSHTAAGSPPSNVGNSYSDQNSESTVWSIASSVLTAQWKNTDSSSPSTTLWYLPGSNALLAVGDTQAFDNAFPGGFAVVFTLV